MTSAVMGAASRLRTWGAGLATTWDRFFFAPIDLFNVSLFRCVFGFAIFFMYIARFREFDLFFTDHGLLPVKIVFDIIPDGFQPTFGFFLKTDSGIHLQALVHLGLCLAFALGLFSRSLTWLLFLINLGLNQRNMSIVYGADLFTNFWLFYLSFVDHNRYFSILNLFGKRRAKVSHRSDMLSTWGVRLLQLQMCMSYAYTGVEKLKGTNWWEGSAVWYVIGMEDLIPHDFAFMKNFPIVIAVMSMATVIFEVYFVFAVWNRKLRYPWLFVGFMFHLSTAIFMDLWFFFLVMVSPYLLYLPSLRESFQQFGSRRMPHS